MADSTDAPTRTALEESGVPGARAPGTPSSSSSSDGTRFVPGQMLDERYRIVGLLGRGGMGEVYRADDLRLGQPVALKLLPDELSHDRERLERFFNEARTARQVTHPNVCRVFDLGGVEGLHYISMEYVDGEDLRTLLQRIGYLPKEKATQIARQLCAGLAAAHDEGILHRDLKPANVMLDGRGRVRITDFGLAGVADEFEAHDLRAGTPAYQAPEQLAGEEVSTASDIYALGLVLYELYTGKKAFEASSATELRQKQLETTPASLSSHVGGLDDTIERIIHRCLDPNPARRPESPLAVSAALPGGDPLAAALAAGETPSPEMVADAGEEGGLKPWIAFALLAAALGGLVLEYSYRTRHSTLGRFGLPKSNTEMVLEAQQVLELAGHEAPPNNVAWSFFTDLDFYSWLEKQNDLSASLDRNDEPPAPGPHQFWYRQSPGWFGVSGFDLATDRDRPASTEPGTVDLRLDKQGRLLELRRLPSLARTEVTEAFDWEPLLAATGIDRRSLIEVEPRINPPLNCGRQWAWEGRYDEPGALPMRLETCTTNGEATYLEVLPPWSARQQAISSEASISDRLINARDTVDLVSAIVFWTMLLGAALLARRNVRLGRADRRGTARLATVAGVLVLISVLLEANHGGSASERLMVFLWACIDAAAWTGLIALLYLAIEPFVRRVWPQTIIAWRRLLEGRLRDPLVGRDILIGTVIAQGKIVGDLLPHLFGASPLPPAGGPLSYISGIRRWAVQTAGMSDVIFAACVFTTIMVLLRIALRYNWLTWLVPTALIATGAMLFVGEPVYAVGAVLSWGGVFFSVIRFGLLSVLAGGIVVRVAEMVRVWDPSSWFFPYVVAGLIVVLLPILYGFVVSLGGRKLFRTELLDS